MCILETILQNKVGENFAMVLQMYDKITIFAIVKLVSYGNFLLSCTLNSKEQIGKSPNTLHRWSRESVLCRYTIYGID